MLVEEPDDAGPVPDDEQRPGPLEVCVDGRGGGVDAEPQEVLVLPAVGDQAEAPVVVEGDGQGDRVLGQGPDGGVEVVRHFRQFLGPEALHRHRGQAVPCMPALHADDTGRVRG